MGILTAILYKPLLKVFEERKKRIAKGLEDAEKIHGELEDIEKKRAEILKEATIKAQKIVDEASGNAKREAVEIFEDQTRRIQLEKSKALEELNSHKTKLFAEVKREILDLALKINTKVLEEGILTDKEHHDLIRQRLKAITGQQQ